MSIIEEINQSLTNFLKQETIYEAQIKALKTILSKKTNNSLSRAYLLNLLTFLLKGLSNGKLTTKGRQMVILAQNPQGIVRPYSTSLNKNFQEKQQAKEASKQKTKAKSKKIKKKVGPTLIPQVEVLQYFDRCNYYFKNSERGQIKFNRCKNILLEIVKHDPELLEKFKTAKDFEDIMHRLPKQERMLELIKLQRFDLNSSKERTLSTSSSIYAISIPMGGQKR
jgi:hypothetical protein